MDLPRSSYYYVAKGEDPYNLELMRLTREHYTKRPFFGIRRMTDHLRRQGHQVNPKRVQRLMRLMGLEALYPKPRTSQAKGLSKDKLQICAVVKPARILLSSPSVPHQEDSP